MKKQLLTAFFISLLGVTSPPAVATTNKLPLNQVPIEKKLINLQ